MSVTGLLRTQVEILRASPSVGDTGEVSASYGLLATTRCTVQRARGRTVRGPAGEEVDVDAVAYLPHGTDVRPEGPGQMPDRVRVFENGEARDYLCVFVDRGFGKGAPVRAGLRAVD